MSPSVCIQSHKGMNGGNEAGGLYPSVKHLSRLFLPCHRNQSPTSLSAVVTMVHVQGSKWTSPKMNPACLAGHAAWSGGVTALSSGDPVDWPSWPLPVWHYGIKVSDTPSWKIHCLLFFLLLFFTPSQLLSLVHPYRKPWQLIFPQSHMFSFSDVSSHLKHWYMATSEN